MLERQRLSQVTGVNDYYADVQTGVVLLATGEKLYRLNSETNEVISTSASSGSHDRKSEYILEAKVCPSNPRLFSYVVDRKVLILF